MKKTFTFLLICLFSAGMVFATDLNFTSLSSQATYGLFLNELDAAASANETSKGPGFTDLESDYLFGGVIGNIEERQDDDYDPTNSTTYSPSFVSGYYNAGENPWSLFAYVDFSGADKGSQTKETVVYNAAGTESTTTTYEVPAYNKINTELQFLKNIGDFNTGLKVSLLLDDNRLPANNYTETSDITGSAYDNTYVDKNGSLFNFGLTVPFFMESGNMKHYAEVSYSRNRSNSSTEMDEKDITAATYNKSTDDNISGTSEMGLLYNVTIPFAAGELTPRVSLYRNGMFSNVSGSSDDGTTQIDYDVTTDYKAGLTMSIGADYYLELNPAGEWLRMRMEPGVGYTRISDAYKTGSSTEATSTTAGVATTTKTSEDNAIAKDITNIFQVNLDTAVEMKPENWFIGFQMGSKINMGVSRNTTEDKAADTTNPAGVTTENKNTTKTIDSTNWTSTVSMEYGFFIPLPEDYRLDFKLNTRELTDLEDITLQLIVPLN